MRERLSIILIFILCLFPVDGLFAQSDVVVKAMKDEMQRNMDELRLEGFANPFFIRYRLTDNFTNTYSASWGSQVEERKDSTRTTAVRLLVGDYQFNDESMDADELSYTDYSYDDLAISPFGTTPVSEDYYGIRQLFWTSTESVYRTASQKFKSYREKLEKENKDISEVLHKRFSKVDVVKHHDDPVELNYAQEEAKQLVESFSDRLIKLSELEGYRISLTANKNTEYFITSEGTEIIKNKVEFKLSFVLNLAKTRSNVRPYKVVSYSGAKFEELQDISSIWKKLQDQLSATLATRSPKALDEPYDGPILFLGKSFGNATKMIGISGYFSASQVVDTVREDYNYNYAAPDKSLEKRMGKRVSSRNLSLLALPSLQEYNGVKISTGYRFDREGVKSPDSLILVDKGVLMNLTNERNVLKAETKPNGTADGPGTVVFKTTYDMSEEELKQNLVEIAEDEGLDFAIIARGADDLFSDISYYRLDLETGKEQLLKNVTLSNFSFNKLRKLRGSSNDEVVNTPSNYFGSYPGTGFGGLTIIHPSAMLISDLELGQQEYNYTMQTASKDQYEFPVPNPRKAKGGNK